MQAESRSSQAIQELSLKQISLLFMRNWPLFVLLFLALTTLSLLFYKFKVPFVSTASIIINDSQNSTLQSFANKLSSGQIKTNEAKKSNSSLQKYLEYLKTTEFYRAYLLNIDSALIDQSTTLAEKEGLEIFKSDFLSNKKNSDLSPDDLTSLYKSIESVLTFKISTDYELEVSASTKNKKLSLAMTKIALKTISETLLNKENLEISKMIEFLSIQKISVDLEIQKLNKSLSDFQDKPENLIALGSPDKVGGYIAELMMRKNELQIKISENNKLISLLTGSGPNRQSQLYGNGGKIQSLKLENEMLRSQIGQTQASIERVSAQAKSLPMAAQFYDELKKKSEIEYSKYKDISESLSNAEAFKLSLNNRFEILESPRLEKVKPLVSVLTLILISFVLSQIIGSLIIYVSTIWDTNMVTAESTRNVMVIDRESLNPKVIIENTKVRFRLKNSNFQNDPENGEAEKIGFNIFKSGQDGTSSTET